MEFEQKYQLISNQSKQELLYSILQLVYDSINSNEQTIVVRILEDIICLDLGSSLYTGSFDYWKKRCRFKVPCMM